jgi:hypothetical protein
VFIHFLLNCFRVMLRRRFRFLQVSFGFENRRIELASQLIRFKNYNNWRGGVISKGNILGYVAV